MCRESDANARYVRIVAKSFRVPFSLSKIQVQNLLNTHSKRIRLYHFYLEGFKTATEESASLAMEFEAKQATRVEVSLAVGEGTLESLGMAKEQKQVLALDLAQEEASFCSQYNTIFRSFVISSAKCKSISSCVLYLNYGCFDLIWRIGTKTIKVTFESLYGIDKATMQCIVMDPQCTVQTLSPGDRSFSRV